MKRIRIVGLALVAVFALSAVAASAALAEPSEFKTATFPVTFTGKGGTAKFESKEGNIVTCEKSESKGTVTGKFAAEVTITYSGNCKLEAVTPIKITETCPTITTSTLAIEPVNLLNGTASTAGLDIKAKSGAIAEFTCTGSDKVKVKVTGSVICESKPIGKKLKTTEEGEVICKEGATLGVQVFTEADNSKSEVFKDFLEAESTLSIFKIKEQDAQTTTEKVKYSAEIEQTIGT